jgi:predicted RNase H-like HicB family nuclease
MSEPRRFAVIVEKGDHNYSAYSPDLPGCVTTGTTVEETLENMKEAISFHLQGLQEDAQSIPVSTSVAVQLLTIDDALPGARG